MIGQTISHYRILSELGKGGMGTVYLAEHILLGRRVALKTLSIEPDKQHYRGRFLREARAASTLNHPHIAAIYDYGETPDGHPFIVMELVEGQTLGDIIGGGELTLARAVEIVEKIAEALAEAHRHRIAHRDIKPANIAVNERAGVKVLDFGLAKLVRGGDASPSDAQALAATETCEDVIIGTPGYLSPEQALGLPVDERCDLFALGAVLYECVTGQFAFPGESAAAIRSKVIRDDPPPPSGINPDVPPELDRITLKALAKKPEQRYQTAEELLADLQRLRSTLPETTAKPSAPKPKPLARRAAARTSALIALSGALARPRVLAAVFLMTFAAALFVVWGGTASPSPPIYTPSPEARQWYDRGTEALRNGSYHTASHLLQAAIKADDKFHLAHARLAEAWSELDYEGRAADEFVRVVQLVPDRSALPALDALYLQATTDTVARDYPKAIEAYRRIEEQVPQTSKASAMLDIGRAYEKSENLDEAIKSFEEAAKRDPRYAAAFLRLGVAYGRKQKLENAKTAFDEAERLYQTLGDLEGVTEVLYQRGTLFNRLRNLAEARNALERALEKAKATDNKAQQILTSLQLSSVIFGQGNTALAQQTAADAVGLAQAGGMENLTTRGLIDLGNAFFSKGDFAEAEKYFKQALEFARHNRGRRNEARASLMLGSLYSNLGRKDESRRFVEQALPFYRQGGYRKEVSQGQNILGHLSNQEGDYRAALAAFDEQEQLGRQLGDESQVALAQLGAGLAFLHQERFAEALERFDSSLTLHLKLGIKQNIGHLLLHRGHARLQLGRLDEARRALAQVEELRAQAGGHGELNALSSLLAARIALVESRLGVARAESQKALDLAGKGYWAVATEAGYLLGLAEARGGAAKSGAAKCEAAVSSALKFGDPRLLAYALLAQAEALMKSGETQKAEAAARRALEISERLGQLESAWRAALLLAHANRLLSTEEESRAFDLRAESLFEQLRGRLPAGAFDDYLARPDVQDFRRLARPGAPSRG